MFHKKLYEFIQFQGVFKIMIMIINLFYRIIVKFMNLWTCGVGIHRIIILIIKKIMINKQLWLVIQNKSDLNNSNKKAKMAEQRNIFFGPDMSKQFYDISNPLSCFKTSSVEEVVKVIKISNEGTDRYYMDYEKTSGKGKGICTGGCLLNIYKKTGQEYDKETLFPTN